MRSGRRPKRARAQRLPGSTSLESRFRRGPLAVGARSGIGLSSGSSFQRRSAIGSSSRAHRSVASAPTRCHGASARRSVTASTSAYAVRPVAVAVPSEASHPRVVRRAAAADHSSSVQPRAGCMEARSRPSSTPSRQTSDSQPSTPAVSRAATCPSPRCSRRIVAACQSRPGASAGQGRSALAPARTRPCTSIARAAASSGPAASSTSMPSSNSASAARAPATRASIAAAGVMRVQMSGRARPTITGAKPKNAATTGPAPIGPSGAVRPAK
jgi:hypothetical protein